MSHVKDIINDLGHETQHFVANQALDGLKDGIDIGLGGISHGIEEIGKIGKTLDILHLGDNIVKVAGTVAGTGHSLAKDGGQTVLGAVAGGARFVKPHLNEGLDGAKLMGTIVLDGGQKMGIYAKNGVEFIKPHVQKGIEVAKHTGGLYLKEGIAYTAKGGSKLGTYLTVGARYIQPYVKKGINFTKEGAILTGTILLDGGLKMQIFIKDGIEYIRPIVEEGVDISKEAFHHGSVYVKDGIAYTKEGGSKIGKFIQTKVIPVIKEGIDISKQGGKHGAMKIKETIKGVAPIVKDGLTSDKVANGLLIASAMGHQTNNPTQLDKAVIQPTFEEAKPLLICQSVTHGSNFVCMLLCFCCCFLPLFLLGIVYLTLPSTRSEVVSGLNSSRQTWINRGTFNSSSVVLVGNSASFAKENAKTSQEETIDADAKPSDNLIIDYTPHYYDTDSAANMGSYSYDANREVNITLAFDGVITNSLFIKMWKEETVFVDENCAILTCGADKCNQLSGSYLGNGFCKVRSTLSNVIVSIDDFTSASPVFAEYSSEYTGTTDDPATVSVAITLRDLGDPYFELRRKLGSKIKLPTAKETLEAIGGAFFASGWSIGGAVFIVTFCYFLCYACVGMVWILGLMKRKKDEMMQA